MSGLTPNSQLEIRTDAPEEEAQAKSEPFNPDDLPEYLRPKTVAVESAKGSVLGIVAVVFFLLAAIGPAAVTYFYLAPKRDDARIDLAAKEKALDGLKKDLEKEEKRGADHVTKLKQITATVTGPGRKPVREALAELDRLAATVAAKRLEQGSFVNFASVSLAESNSVSVSGQVDSYLTLADWLEALQTSPLFRDVKFSGASEGEAAGETSVPFALTFTFVPPKPEVKKDPATPAAPAAPEGASPTPAA